MLIIYLFYLQEQTKRQAMRQENLEEDHLDSYGNFHRVSTLRFLLWSYRWSCHLGHFHRIECLQRQLKLIKTIIYQKFWVVKKQIESNYPKLR